MLQSLSHGWHELSNGRYGEAEQVFRAYMKDNPDSTEALRGLARLALHRGNLDQAEQLGRRALSIDPNGDVQLLMGEIMGAQGKRREAESYLEHAVAFHSSDPYARALLGEQKIRQGRWDEGTDDFIEAMSSDPEGDAFRHLQSVLADLVDAYVAGRIPEQDAMGFVNRIDYSVPKSGPEMQSFFAEARRAINGRRALNRRDHVPEQTLPKAVRNASSAPSSGGSSRPPSPQQAPKQPPQNRRPPQQSRQRRQQPRAAATTSAAQRDNNQQGIDANQKDLQAIIQRERSLNRDLLADLQEMGPPEWPSEAGYDSIDNVPPISLDRGSILGDSGGIDTRDFRVTSGDLLAEIFLERCLRNLLVATQKNKATTITLRPESIWQVELNCRDGLLDDMRPLSPLYQDRPGFEDFRQLALGMFIGECLTRTYDGAWTFQTPASESYLEIGNMLLEPFELARQWMAADDKDDVDLYILARQAEQASEESTSLTMRSDHIDPTKELSREALPAKLAEMWALYRFKLSDTSFSKIADTLEIVTLEEDVIVFKIGAEWVPQYGRGPQGAAVLDDGAVVMAYLRHTGEFVPLASRNGLARYFQEIFGELDQQAARRAVDALAKHHRPGWWVATNDKRATELSQKVGSRISSPSLERQGSATTLVVSGVSSEGPVQWRLTHDPHRLVTWQLELRQS